MFEKIITILYLSGDGISINKVAKLLGLTKEDVEKEIDNIKKSLETVGLLLVINNEELSIVTKPEFSELVNFFWKSELEGELSPATLQVLTLVAYLNGPKRDEISYIRGVQSSQSIRTLLVRGLIVKNNESYFLTNETLKCLGINSVEMLPDYENIRLSLNEKLKSKEQDQ